MLLEPLDRLKKADARLNLTQGALEGVRMQQLSLRFSQLLLLFFFFPASVERRNRAPFSFFVDGCVYASYDMIGGGR